jgi:hypothetical protein
MRERTQQCFKTTSDVLKIMTNETKGIFVFEWLQNTQLKLPVIENPRFQSTTKMHFKVTISGKIILLELLVQLALASIVRFRKV